jgi:hypothetical protein
MKPEEAPLEPERLIIEIIVSAFWNLRSSVGVMTRKNPGQQDNLDSKEGQECFSSSQRRDLLWGPPGLLFNGYQWVYPREGGEGT